ncbi:MAG: hypothetical protein H8E34_06120 [Bacteroidetes bacterium]|nr:hypothetical protein [Bacteroidota bacterium]MBL6944580.1 hypothetical protein [Bacteroidales bacterium]
MKKVLIAFTVILLSSSLYAQFGELLRFNSGGIINVQWDMAKPIGSMSDFVNTNSFKGFNIDYRHCYKKNIIIGGRTGLNNFYENRGLTNIKDGSSTSYLPIDHKISAVPMMFVVDYLVKSEKFIPYAGIGIGAYFINSSVISTNTITENTFHFGVSPEVGITIPFIISNFGLNACTKYNFALGAGSSSGYSWFDFNIGLSFMY